METDAAPATAPPASGDTATVESSIDSAAPAADMDIDDRAGGASEEPKEVALDLEEKKEEPASIQADDDEAVEY